MNRAPAWDPNADVDAFLAEYFALGCGPFADRMRSSDQLRRERPRRVRKPRRTAPQPTPRSEKLAAHVSLLTADEAARYDAIRRQVEEEFAGRIRPREASPAVQAVIAALKTAREAQGLSLADIRERTGIERSALSRLENAVPNLTVRTLERYAQAVGKRIVIQLEEM